MLKQTFKLSTESNREYIYRTIQESIVEFYLRPNDRINEIAIAEKLNLSRTPVREALILLEKNCLIEVRPKVGTFVTKINSNSIKTVVFMRKVLETEIIRLACQQLNTKDLEAIIQILNAQKTLLTLPDEFDTLFSLDNLFHQAIYSAVGKEKIWLRLQNFSNPFNRARKLDIMLGNVEKRIDEHEELLEIIQNRQLEKVEIFVAKHLNNVDELLERLTKEFAEYFETV
ncbi:DNA-binding transcriptional regulator, GntR family [Pilibacter termitis]|uniref:DNA-binding transcriptional regulator, GntR family n=1 Tax=Pilibacter termitis TaxID=263852 RepID=A0A1T4RET8_9ENTE|nr:GntR family transcriptional regulator [Pilibacter termitis]SKA14326.1 DNA-binding transcriptional regulator, GntR family [Pilibacter termitis]